jgi:hypothetical protein
MAEAKIAHEMATNDQALILALQNKVSKYGSGDV